MMALAGLCQARPQDFMLETQQLKSLHNRYGPWPARVERASQNHATLVWVILDQPKFDFIQEGSCRLTSALKSLTSVLNIFTSFTNATMCSFQADSICSAKEERGIFCPQTSQGTCRASHSSSWCFSRCWTLTCIPHSEQVVSLWEHSSECLGFSASGKLSPHLEHIICSFPISHCCWYACWAGLSNPLRTFSKNFPLYSSSKVWVWWGFKKKLTMVVKLLVFSPGKQLNQLLEPSHRFLTKPASRTANQLYDHL